MVLEPIYPGNVFNESFAVWLDIDQDGVLSDDEKILEVDGISQIYEEVVTIPGDIELGNMRMRVGMRFNAQPPSCTGDNFQAFGETEDYCFTITEFACTPIAILDTTFTSLSEIGLIFSENLNVDESFVSYKRIEDTDWVEESITDLDYVVGNLEDCKIYEFRTRTLCGTDFTDYTDPVTYSTRCLISTESYEESKIKIYPNPFSDVFSIEFISEDINNMTYEIYNQLGAVVQKSNLSNASKQEITSNVLASGVYYIRIMSEGETITYRKIVKM
jgi:hypothetical protein